MREGVGALVQKGVYYREILLHKQKVLDIFNLKRGYEVQKYFFLYVALLCARVLFVQLSMYWKYNINYFYFSYYYYLIICIQITIIMIIITTTTFYIYFIIFAI